MNNETQILVHQVQQGVRQEHEQKKQVHLTREKIRQELFFKSHNRVHKNGRIYGFFDKDGNKVTSSISPDYEKFHTQVEEGIYPHVMALKTNGYFTISSCQGHPYNMYVKIGFGTKKCRDEFIDSIQRANIPFLRCIERDVEINQSTNLSDTGVVIGRARFHQEGDLNHLRKVQAENFNLQFNTNFKNWYIADIYLLRPPSSIFHPIQRLKTMLSVKNKPIYSEQLLNYFSDLEQYSDVYSRNYLSTFAH